MLWGLFLCTLMVATTTVSSNPLFDDTEVAKDDSDLSPLNEDYDPVEKRAINPFQNGFAGQTHALRIRRGLSNYNNHALRVRSMPSIRSSAYAHALRVKKDPPVYNRYTRYSPVGHALRIKKGGFSGFNHALRVRRGGENEATGLEDYYDLDDYLQENAPYYKRFGANSFVLRV